MCWQECFHHLQFQLEYPQSKTHQPFSWNKENRANLNTLFDWKSNCAFWMFTFNLLISSISVSLILADPLMGLPWLLPIIKAIIETIQTIILVSFIFQLFNLKSNWIFVLVIAQDKLILYAIHALYIEFFCIFNRNFYFYNL